DLHYVRRKLQFWDWVDSDFISLFDLDSFLVDAGYLHELGVNSIEAYRVSNECSYYWSRSGDSMIDNLLEMKFDKDVHNMFVVVAKKSKLVKVFLIKKAELQKMMSYANSLRFAAFETIPTTQSMQKDRDVKQHIVD
ncbi:hypothetical protein LINPERPRIM_LOCUS218, partial [Linum perenne]